MTGCRLPVVVLRGALPAGVRRYCQRIDGLFGCPVRHGTGRLLSCCISDCRLTGRALLRRLVSGRGTKARDHGHAGYTARIKRVRGRGIVRDAVACAAERPVQPASGEQRGNRRFRRQRRLMVFLAAHWPLMSGIPGVVQGAIRDTRRRFGVCRTGGSLVTVFVGSVCRAGVCRLYRDGGQRRRDGLRAKKGQVDRSAYGVAADGRNEGIGGASPVVMVTIASIKSGANLGVLESCDWSRGGCRLRRFRGS